MENKAKKIFISLNLIIPIGLSCVGSIFLIIFYDAIFGYSMRSGILVSLLIGGFVGATLFTGIKILASTEMILNMHWLNGTIQHIATIFP